MTPEEYETLPDQSKRYYCEVHGCSKIKNMMGVFVCLFCEREEWENDES